MQNGINPSVRNLTRISTFSIVRCRYETAGIDNDQTAYAVSDEFSFLKSEGWIHLFANTELIYSMPPMQLPTGNQAGPII